MKQWNNPLSLQLLEKEGHLEARLLFQNPNSRWLRVACQVCVAFAIIIPHELASVLTSFNIMQYEPSQAHSWDWGGRGASELSAHRFYMTMMQLHCINGNLARVWVMAGKAILVLCTELKSSGNGYKRPCWCHDMRLLSLTSSWTF